MLLISNHTNTKPPDIFDKNLDVQMSFTSTKSRESTTRIEYFQNK